jgi:hypothetical protein
MKNHLQDLFPKNIRYDTLRNAIKEAWDKIMRHKFEELINSMKARCQAVINTKGLFTKY